MSSIGTLSVREMHYKLKNPFSERLEKAVSLQTRRSAVVRYGLVVILCLLASFLFLGTRALLGATSPFLFFLGAILLTAWFSGLRAGIFTFIFGLVLGWITFVGPGLHHPGTAFARMTFQSLLYLIESPLLLILIHRRNKTYENMQARAAQQAIIATIGQFGLEESNLGVFMDRVVRAVGRTLVVDYVSILELLPEGDCLRMCAGIGWKRGVVGHTLIDAKKETQASYTLINNKPVIMNDLLKEKRFKPTELMRRHEVTSGLSVVIPGNPSPFGVLSLHTREKRVFTKDDVNFLLALAHVLATTIEHGVNQKELELMAKLNSELISLDPQKTLSGVVATIVPAFADICEIYIKRDDSKTDLLEVKASTKEKEHIFRLMGEKYPPVATSKRPTAKVLRTNKPFYYPRVPATYPQDASSDKEHEKLLKRINLLSNIVVPIKIRHKTTGTIGFGTFGKGRIYTQRDFLLAQEIADRVAIAIDNATLYQEAKTAVQARDEFLSIASHELKTPLTSMLLQLQTVLHSIKSQSLASFSIEKTMTSLESTIAQSRRLSKLVNDLLNISLITTGRLELERERTDLTKIVNEVCTRLQDEATKSGSKITITPSKPLVGNWDRIRIEQVVTNLLTNALKYGDNKPIEVELQNSNKQATLRVKDHGLGISKGHQEKIFDRFARGEVKASIKGLGVGLYLVNEIVRAHGGKIAVSSIPREGSTFTIQLPL